MGVTSNINMNCGGGGGGNGSESCSSGDCSFGDDLSSKIERGIITYPPKSWPIQISKKPLINKQCGGDQRNMYPNNEQNATCEPPSVGFCSKIGNTFMYTPGIKNIKYELLDNNGNSKYKGKSEDEIFYGGQPVGITTAVKSSCYSGDDSKYGCSPGENIENICLGKDENGNQNKGSVEFMTGEKEYKNLDIIEQVNDFTVSCPPYNTKNGKPTFKGKTGDRGLLRDLNWEVMTPAEKIKYQNMCKQIKSFTIKKTCHSEEAKKIVPDIDKTFNMSNIELRKQLCESFNPVNCVLSDWKNSGTCSKSCGGGKQKQTKSIITQAQNGGTPCPASSELERLIDCNTQACPVNCVLSDWKNLGTCSKSCGGGKQKQIKSIVTQAQNGGTACPALSELERLIDCNTQACSRTTPPPTVPIAPIRPPGLTCINIRTEV